jgi:proteasome lid subunit RPN8/RPN11
LNNYSLLLRDLDSILSPTLKTELLEYSRAQAPKEACGLITDAGFIPAVNKSRNPTESFLLHPKEALAQAEGAEVLAYFHSHPAGQMSASIPDKAGCERTKKPWVILTLPMQHWTVLEPCGYVAPLVNRPWLYGSLDCAGIVIDAYKQLGIDLPDYERPPFGAWLRPGWRGYLDIYEGMGFVKTDEPRPFDVLLMQYECENVNHSGILLSQGQFLHHLYDQLSRPDTWAGNWRQCTKLFLRHPEVGDRHLTQSLNLHEPQSFSTAN